MPCEGGKAQLSIDKAKKKTVKYDGCVRVAVENCLARGIYNRKLAVSGLVFSKKGIIGCLLISLVLERGAWFDRKISG